MKKVIGMLAALMLFVGSFVVGGTVDQTGGGTANQGAAAFPAGLPTPIILSATVDFAVTNAAAGDLFKVITIPSNCLVQAVWYTNLRTNTAACTYCIGDSSSTSTWASAVNMATANTGTLAYGTTSNAYYSAANYLTIQPEAAATTGKVKVSVVLIPFKP